VTLVAGRSRPPWPTGCYSLRYRLANNGANHDEIQIEWFLDDELLDTKHYGSEIYNNDGTVIGDGLLPIPLAMGQHCCVGGNNRLQASASATSATTTRSRTSACSCTTARASSAARRARWAGRATAAARRSFRGAAERESVNEWDPVAMRPKMECI
jgi:hypothetical protein